MKPPPILYHGSRGENKESILTQGLLARGVERLWSDSAPFVHMTEEMGWASRWVAHAFRSNPLLVIPDPPVIVIFQIDTTQLDPTKFSPDHIGMQGDWRYNGDVPPHCIKLVSERPKQVRKYEGRHAHP